MQRQTSPSWQPALDAVTNLWASESGPMLLGALVLMVLLQVTRRPQQGKLARGRLAGAKEIKLAQKLAKNQIKIGKHNRVTLYLGKPGKKTTSTYPLYLPDAQRGMAVCGGPGSGKTFSAFNPALRSAIAQGFPILLYDFKYPDQTSAIAAYAAKCDYDVRVFAPGFNESEVCNPLDFIRDETDGTMARQMAVVLNRNLALNANSSEDKFFSEAGDQLVQAALMLAKAPLFTSHNLITAACIISLDNLPARIRNLRGKINDWTQLAFAQLLQLESSPKTVSGVIGTANKIFQRFLDANLARAFCGETTLPLDLHGRQLIVFGMDRQRREAVGPLLATLFHLIVARNVSVKRKIPLIASIDEAPTLYLPYLVNWLNESRSDGLVTMLGFQNLTQLEKAYSREISRAIFAACGTKLLFNPQEAETAEYFAKYLGNEEIQLRTRSRSRGKGQTTNSDNQQFHSRPLVEASQFNKFPPGKCVLVNPGYGDRRETALPLPIQIRLTAEDCSLQEWAEAVWPKVQQRLSKRSKQASEDALSELLKEIAAEVENQVPMPEEGEEKAKTGAGVPSAVDGLRSGLKPAKHQSLPAPKSGLKSQLSGII